MTVYTCPKCGLTRDVATKFCVRCGKDQRKQLVVKEVEDKRKLAK